MGAINDAFNKAGWSILSLASATAKYRARRNEEGKNRAKLNYSTAATIKKQNNVLTKKQSEPPKSYYDINSPLPPEKDEQKIAEQKVLEQMAQERAKATSFGELAGVEEAPAPNQEYISSIEEATVPKQEYISSIEEATVPKQTYTSSEEGAYLPIIKAENTETKIPVDEEVQGLIEVKQKNALRAAAGQRSQKRYQDIKERLTYRFADEHNIEDVWRNISLAPDITDEMIRKAGYTKTKILEEWKYFNDWPTEWLDRMNNMGDDYGVGGGNPEEGESFGRILSAYIKAKAGGKTLKQQEEEYELSKFSPEEEKNYKVWQDEQTEKEKDETKKDKDSGIIF